MTEHPLTDDMLKQIQSENPMRIYGTQAMRAAYDVGRDEQLEQVMKWMKVNLMKHDFHEGYAYLYDDCSNAYIREEELLKDLKQAMRPTTTQEETE